MMKGRLRRILMICRISFKVGRKQEVVEPVFVTLKDRSGQMEERKL